GPSASFETGMVEFEKENFERAEEMMVIAMNGLDDIETRAALSRAAEKGQLEYLAETAFENRALITASVILFLLASVIASFKVRKMRKAGKVAYLKKEIDALKDSIKALQNEYFNKKSLSRKNYETRMQEYKKGLSDAMSVLEAEKRSLR
ncbi:MAG: hypothetical protein KAI64_01810, partial [Thermoplasmata archaeon]|nr:hypothetical protein [Thermoplasmata archaeon]